MKYIFPALILVFTFMWQIAAAEAQNPRTYPRSFDDTEIVNAELLEKSFPTDIVVGSAEAPVTIIEYASLSCPHCAKFHHDVLPELKKRYIDTGKAKLVFRHFPLNASALKAAMLVQCVDTERQQDFLKALFEAQSDWAFTRKYIEKLRSVAKIGGLSGEEFDECVTLQEAEDNILMHQLKASRDLKVSSTPTFFVNGKKLPGGSIDDFSAVIDALIKE